MTTTLHAVPTPHTNPVDERSPWHPEFSDSDLKFVDGELRQVGVMFFHNDTPHYPEGYFKVIDLDDGSKYVLEKIGYDAWVDSNNDLYLDRHVDAMDDVNERESYYLLGTVNTGDPALLTHVLTHALDHTQMPEGYLAGMAGIPLEVLEKYLDGSVTPTLSISTKLIATIERYQDPENWEDWEDLCSCVSGTPWFELSKFDKAIGRTIGELLEEAGWGFYQLAMVTEMDVHTLHAIVWGQASSDMSEIFQISQAFGIAPSELMRRASIHADAEEGK